MKQIREMLENLPAEWAAPTEGSPPARILTATRGILAEGGVAAVSMRAVAAGAQVNQAMIHYYFGSKERLLDMVVAQEILHLLHDVVGSMADLEPTATLLVQHPLRVIDALRRDPTRLRLVRSVLATEPERLQRVIHALGGHGILGAADALSKVVTAARERAEVPDVDPRSILLFLLASAYGLVFLAPVASEITGFDLDDDDDWLRHRRNLAVLLRNGVCACGGQPS